MATFTRTYKQDLNSVLQIHYSPEIVFSKDNLANTINLELYQGDEAYSAGGTVSGTVINAAGATVPITSCSISGNVVTVALNEACLEVPGPIQVYVRLTSGSVKTTVFAGVYTVIRTETETVIDPGYIIDSVTDLINSIETAIGHIPADYTQLQTSFAPMYSTSSTYAVGDYVWYNGLLYRCTTAITTAEAWTAAHWTRAVFGDDISSLKSAISDSDVIPVNSYNTIPGFMSSTGKWNNISTAYKHIVFPVNPGDTVLLQFNSGAMVGFLKTYTGAVDGAAIDYSAQSGYTDRLQIGTSVFNGVVPSDCHYIVVNTLENYIVKEATMFVINGVDYSKTAHENYNKKIDDTLGDAERIIPSHLSYNGFVGQDTNWRNVNNLYQFIVIPINPGDHVEIEKSTDNDHYYAVFTEAFQRVFNGEHAPLSAVAPFTTRILYTGADADFIAPADAKYLYFNTVYNGYEVRITKVKINGVRLFEETVLDSINSLDKKVEEFEEVIDMLSPISSNIAWQNGGFSDTIGYPSSEVGNNIRRKTGYLSFPANLNVRDISGTYLIGITLYDSERIVTSKVVDSTPYDVIPAHTIFRIRLRLAEDDTQEITDTNDQINAKIQFSIVSGKTNSDVNWLALGDSITQGYISIPTDPGYTLSTQDAWAYKLQKITQWNLKNEAIGGTGWVRNHPDTSDAGWNVVQNIDFTNYDIVTIAYGVNDWKYNCYLGTFEDYDPSASPETIYSAMRKTIETIIASNPFCKIFVITPVNCATRGTEETNWGIGASYSHNGTLEDIFTAMKTVCDYYGVQLIDMLHSSIVNRKNIKQCLLDDVHPTPEAHTAMAHEIGGRITWAY